MNKIQHPLIVLFALFILLTLSCKNCCRRRSKENGRITRGELIMKLSEIKENSENLLYLYKTYEQDTTNLIKIGELYIKVQVSQNSLIDLIRMDIIDGRLFIPDNYTSILQELNSSYRIFLDFIRKKHNTERLTRSIRGIDLIEIAIETIKDIITYYSRKNNELRQSYSKILEEKRIKAFNEFNIH